MLKAIISITIISLISIAYANKSENTVALYGIQFSENSLTIQVASNGYTRVDDFEIHEKLSLGIHHLSYQ